MLIEAKACGIYGTDIRIWHDQFPCWPPVTMGHEFAGEIVPSLPQAGEGRRSKLSIASSPMGRRQGIFVARRIASGSGLSCHGGLTDDPSRHFAGGGLHRIP